ncbi:DUF2085 domain-containing protein [Methanoregula sp.]|uniref:DUF2085 domain-containing protein n=1 Tax=Methanoregula sp. TaxID=2052170 RepID=UPI003D0A17FE
MLYITIKKRTFGFCICHRRKDRSFHFFGLENVLCSRCLGSLIGGISAIIAGFWGFVFPIFWAVIFVIPLILDGLYQAFSQRQSNNLTRFITGLLCGWGIVFIGMFCGGLIHW